MAKLLMSCDDYVYEHNGIYYAESQECYEFYQRYLRVFDELKLVCRCECEENLKVGRISLEKDKRIEFIPVPMFHGIKEYSQSYFAVGKSIRHIMNGCDAAILRIPSTLAIRVGNKVMKSGIPYACEVVYDAEDGWRGYKGLSRLAWKRIDKQMKKMCSSADGVSCVTKHYLQRHYFPLKNDSFVENYSSLSISKSFYGQPKCLSKKDTIVIAHIASQIGEQSAKGHKQTIEAVKILKDRGIKVIVKFAGRNHNGGIEIFEKVAEELRVKDCVEFVGFLDRDKLSTFLQGADIYVMPTKAEGLPRVIIEAMAKGLPCITTPVSGNPELVGEHFLVDYYDVKSLADRIEEIVKDKDLYERTSKENYEKSLKYEASILEKRRDSFYNKLKQRISV